MPAGDQIDCYLSCNIRINKGELKKQKTSRKETEQGVCPADLVARHTPFLNKERKGRKENYFSGYCHQSTGLFDPQGQLPAPDQTGSVEEELAGHVFSCPSAPSLAATFPWSGLDVPHDWIILKFENWMSDETT